MTHVMLDLETWGVTPGSDIRSIGACVFDPTTGKIAGFCHEVGTFYIACNNPTALHWPDGQSIPISAERKYPLTRDARTAQWWSEQSDDAQAAFTDPVDLREALERFGRWLTSLDYFPGAGASPTLRIWAHGSHFDLPILAAAYEAVGLLVPWHYRAPRDTRTCFDMAGITDHSAWLNRHPGPLGTPHHALDDAICQARAVCGAYAEMRHHVNAAALAALPDVQSFDVVPNLMAGK